MFTRANNLKSMFIALLALIVSCGGGSSSGNTPVPVAGPTITSFTAAKSLITAGSTTILTAVFNNGIGTVNQGIGVIASGTPVTTPSIHADMTFTLTVTGAGGTLTKALQVAVAPVSKPIFMLPGNVPLKMQSIPAGTFTMGSPDTEKSRYSNEGPQHSVSINAFYMGQFEVTQAQWLALMGSNPSYWTGDLNRPVEQVSYNRITQADGFLDRLNAATVANRPPGFVFRLPTEAEWEYAARGNQPSYQVFGYGNSLGSTQANFNGTYPYGGAPMGDCQYRTTAVGSYQPTSFGLYDMHGNVWEWCQDWYSNSYYASSPLSDPPGPASGSYRVLRGGSWDSYGHYCRSAYRDVFVPSNYWYVIGFRVVLSSPRTP